MANDQLDLIVLNGAAGSGKDTVGTMIVELAYARTMAFADPMKDFAQRVFGFTTEQLYGPSSERNRVDPRSGTILWRRECTIAFLRESGPWLLHVLPTEDIFASLEATRSLALWFSSVIRHKEITPRYVLQTLGTEWGRDTVDTAIWIKHTFKRSKLAIGSDGDLDLVIVTDCRFENEAETAKKLGAALWHVKRDAHLSSEAQAAGVVGHKSETEQASESFKLLIDLTLDNNGTLDDLKKKVQLALAHNGLRLR